ANSWSADLAARYRPRQPIGPPVPQEMITRFELFSSLAYAVQHSRTYQDQMDSLYATALTVTLERHLFTPRPFANTGIKYTGGQRTSDFKSAFTVTNQVGLRQQLPYGGEVVASALVDFVNALHGNVEDGETAALALEGSMPLLRGFGMVNLEPLISSERTLVYRVRDFEEFRRSFVVDTARAYFNLLAAQQGIRSEEHTSELQSLRHLVCRLLLEKKKKKNKNYMLANRKQIQSKTITQNKYHKVFRFHVYKIIKNKIIDKN